MCQDDVLKENVDGEAVLWAYKRLLERPEPRRVLMTISDGAPLDDATLEANDPLYLDRHLCMVIEHIERQGAIELAAIGIGHDVTGFYRRAITLSSVDELGEAMVAQLVDLFSPLPRRRVVSGAARPRTSAQRAG
jgi:cobaltochelatase CobT